MGLAIGEVRGTLSFAQGSSEPESLLRQSCAISDPLPPPPPHALGSASPSVLVRSASPTMRRCPAVVWRRGGSWRGKTLLTPSAGWARPLPTQLEPSHQPDACSGSHCNAREKYCSPVLQQLLCERERRVTAGGRPFEEQDHPRAPAILGPAMGPGVVSLGSDWPSSLAPRGREGGGKEMRCPLLDEPQSLLSLTCTETGSKPPS